MVALSPHYLTLPLTTSVERLAIGRRNFFRIFPNDLRYDFVPGCSVSYSLLALPIALIGWASEGFLRDALRIRSPTPLPHIPTPAPFVTL